MSSILQTKRCSKCGRIKLIIEYPKSTVTHDGMKSYCNACVVFQHPYYTKRSVPPESISAQYGKIRRRYQKQLCQQRRHARMHSLPDILTTEQWQACLEYWNYCCAVCGKQLRDLFGEVKSHADHWIPLSLPDCPGTIATNMICLCNKCNLSKRDMMPLEWLIRRYDKQKANQIMKRVESYFESL